MRAANPVENSDNADTVRMHGSSGGHHPTPVYAKRANEDWVTATLSLDVDLRGWPAQLAQWLIVFGALGLLIGGAKWWAGRDGRAPGAQPASISSLAPAPVAPERSSGADTGIADAAGSTGVRTSGVFAPTKEAPGSGMPAAEASNRTPTPDFLLTPRVRAPADVPYPRRLHDVQPTVPAGSAVRRGIAVLSLLIDARGDVADVEILRGITPGLDAAAVAAARQWKFAPTVHDGKPVAVSSNFTVRFGY